MARALKIMHVMLSLDVGGLERNVVNQVRCAGPLGQQVSIICLERPGAMAERARSLGAEVICLHKRPGIRLGIVGQLKTVLRELRPDVVHTHQISSLFYAGAAARAERVPVIVHTEHGQERYGQRLRTRWLGRLAGRYVQRFYCLTADMAGQIGRQRIVPPRKLRVILNGIDTAQFSERCDTASIRRALGIPAEAALIGSVGRLTEVKCQELLIRAVARVRRQVPEAHLLIVGEGPLKGALAELGRSLGLEGVLHLAGYQANTAPYIQAMDVFALTSRSEGMPQAALEASVAGVPVIASRVGGLPELIEDGRTGVLFASGDEEELVAALGRVLKDREWGRRLGGAARVRVEAMFDIRRMAGEYQRDYLELMREAGADGKVQLSPQVRVG